jgi:hypothetical protein
VAGLADDRHRWALVPVDVTPRATYLGRGIGALSPLFVGLLADAISIGVAIAMFAGLACLLMALCALLLPEIRGAELTGTSS